jgi:deoxyribose-phosphate aldolase
LTWEPKTDKNFPFMTDRISAAIKTEISADDRRAILKFILGIIDLTSLEGNDTRNKIKELCDKAQNSKIQAAAVCTYPVFINDTSELLKDTDINTAVVAGGFPGGQVPASVKISEVQYAVDHGADEVDFVINRGLMLEGRFDEVYEEVFMAAQLCTHAHLKVILETGELKTKDNIRRASEIAMTAGADFIKTSTGKVQPAATLEATLIMLDAISDHHNKTRKMVGIKPAGGIGDPDTAIKYYLLVQHVLGSAWINKSYFRIGASRLFDNILNELSAG